MRHEPASRVAARVMLEGPVTFRPSNGVKETADWMDRNDADTVIVTSSYGSLLGIVQPDDLLKTNAGD